LDRKLEDKGFCTKWWQAFPDLNLLLILDIQLRFVTSKSSPPINLDLSTQKLFLLSSIFPKSFLYACSSYHTSSTSWLLTCHLYSHT
jgi:hypothetical protein